MKIYLERTIGEVTTRYWLVGCDGMDMRVWTDALQHSRQILRKQQIASGVDWDHIFVRDRRNAGVVIEAGTARTFATELECWEFTNSLTREDGDKPHPLKGDVYLRLELPGGTWVDERILSAGVAVTAVDIIGAVGLRLRYRITGGKTEGGYTGGSGAYSWISDSHGQLLKDSGGRWIGDSDHET